MDDSESKSASESASATKRVEVFFDYAQQLDEDGKLHMPKDSIGKKPLNIDVDKILRLHHTKKAMTTTTPTQTSALDETSLNIDEKKVWRHIDSHCDKKQKDKDIASLNAVLYITYGDFIEKFNRSLDKFFNYLEHRNYIMMSSTSNFHGIKSSFWCLLLAVDYIKKSGYPYPDDIVLFNVFLPLTPQPLKKILLVDDIIYSGSQMSEAINGLFNPPEIIPRISADVEICICAAYISTIAEEKLEKLLIKLRIGEISVKPLVNLFIEGRIPSEKFNGDYTRLVYADHKLPDLMSTNIELLSLPNDARRCQGFVRDELIKDYVPYYKTIGLKIPKEFDPAVQTEKLIRWED